MMLTAIAPALGQADGQTTTRPTEELISLDFPDNVELKTLVDYVSRRLKINILYDEQAVSQRVTIKAPARVPEGSLLGLLEGALKVKGFVLVESDTAGWKRIVAVANLPNAARPVTQPSTQRSLEPNEAVAQVFVMRYADAARADQVIKPFLSQPGGNSVALADGRTLIVTDFASTVQRIAQLIQLLDQPHRPTEVRFQAVHHVDAAQLAPQVMQILGSKAKSNGPAPQAGGDAVDITADPRTNQIILVGSSDLLAEAARIAESLDVPLKLDTRTYRFQSAAPDRIDRIVRELAGSLDVRRAYQSVVDSDGGLLIVTTTSAMHDQINSLKQELDVPVDQGQSPVRFYKLTNAIASEVLQTIRASVDGVSPGPVPIVADALQSTATVGRTMPEFAGPNRPPPAPGQPPPEPPIYRPSDPDGDRSGAPASQPSAPVQSFKAGDATVTADANTNTIIVVGPPAIQRVYEQMIRMLDRRRPQVLIEATIVTLDTSDNFSLGVELARVDGNDIFFSSFGLSTPGEDEDIGKLTLIPGLGFNGAIIDADLANVIVRALKSSGRSKVLSAPRILVNDNATGTLSSVAEAPYISTNASNTVATTSFAGYASAGTVITVTPHISEGDHLKLEYTVALNSFTGKGGSGSPPPRQTDSVESEVTIPDGHTIIVGGLNRASYSETKDAIPLLGDIPIVDLLFSSRSKTESNVTLFVFLRPVILRDDQFEDLKYLSQRDVATAGIARDFPVSEPFSME